METAYYHMRFSKFVSATRQRNIQMRSADLIGSIVLLRREFHA